MTNILHIDASGRQQASQSRKLSTQIVNTIKKSDSRITYRDVGEGLAFVDDSMIGSYFTAPEQRTDGQNQSILMSDTITRELIDNEVVVIGIPIYNFSMPAAFKAWCDLAARVGVTFKYTDTGPVGLLRGKKAYVVISSGGTRVDSEIDFLTPWLRHYLNFIGISDVEIIQADGLGSNAETSLAMADAHIKSLGMDTNLTQVAGC